MNVKHSVLTSLLLVFSTLILAQKVSNRPHVYDENVPINTAEEYKWWNLLHYSIDITPDYDNRLVSGTNVIEFCSLETGSVLRIDLQEPMVITKVTWRNSSIEFKKQNDAYIIIFPKKIVKGKTEAITITFKGHPPVALNPPFDSGWDMGDR